MKVPRLSVFLLFFFVSCFARASDLAFSENARTFESQHATLLVKSLAFACLGLFEVADGVPCNPAMTSKATKGSLKAQGLLSNGYSTLSTTRQLLNGTPDQNLVNDLFNDQRVLQAESQIDISFTSKYINSSYSPFTTRYFSVVRNDADPDVDLFAVQEQIFLLQSGVSLGDFDFGVEFRQSTWKFIKQRFELLSLATPEGMAALQPQTQTAYFVQPAMNYNIPNFWDARVSAYLVNLGYVNQHYDNFNHPVELQMGFAISPPVWYGKLDLLVDYKSLSYEETDAGEKIHFGALYRYGAMNLAFGLDNNGVSTGIFYGLEQINAGILFSTTKLPWKEDDYYAQTVYVQVGWQL